MSLIITNCHFKHCHAFVLYETLKILITLTTEKEMDAVLITRLLEAGGTIAGRAVCENMCHSATSHSSATGVVHNPYAKGYSSGGSSSGCGALVANGDVDLAVGADQGGSIRVVSK
jgi:Asp-tRNA(Asn)/Glu-tRNA(Gln) amidotransferase A subunit family amidase